MCFFSWVCCLRDIGRGGAVISTKGVYSLLEQQVSFCFIDNNYKREERFAMYCQFGCDCVAMKERRDLPCTATVGFFSHLHSLEHRAVHACCTKCLNGEGKLLAVLCAFFFFQGGDDSITKEMNKTLLSKFGVALKRAVVWGFFFC